MRVKVKKVGDSYWVFISDEEASGVVRAKEVYAGSKKVEGGPLELEVDKVELVDGVAYLWASP